VPVARRGPRQIREPCGDAAGRGEERRRGAPRFTEGRRDRGLDADRVDERRVGDGVHHAAVARQQLAERVLVVRDYLLDQRPIRGVWISRCNAIR